jgi:hypothetical protein
MTIRLATSRPGFVAGTLGIYDVRGRLIFQDQLQFEQETSYTWRGVDMHDRQVASGRYLVGFAADDGTRPIVQSVLLLK